MTSDARLRALLDAMIPPRGRRALLLCDGEPAAAPLLATALAGVDLFVCADGAGRPYDRLPRPPDVVIGDFDSLGDPPARDDICFLRVAEQESSDAQKALRHIFAEGCTEALVLGATGKRLDHTLYNLSLLERFADRLRLLLVAADSLNLRLGPGDPQHWPLPAGTRFSLLPLAGPAHGVDLRGAAYPLATAELSARSGPASVSNRVLAPPLQLSIEEGSLLISVSISDPGKPAP